ncbi:uncharacterized protein LOC101235030 isoform X3 [Hydra vulgaris]|uniref:Uncharacterized protein LOC101235030 isoform X3 n=1 Tax=Hydra vulgaris TaxID=6087 RepID=A0ABM4DQJ8_HYDVU
MKKMRSLEKVLLIILLYCFHVVQISESSAQVKIFLETFKLSGLKKHLEKPLIKPKDHHDHHKRLFKFEICFGTETLNCFLSNILSLDEKTKMIHFPQTLSKDVNNPLILKSPSSKVDASLRINIYHHDKIFFQHELSTKFSFDSVGVKRFTLTNDKNLRSPKDKSELSFTVSLNCDDNFKPPDCVEKACVEHDDDVNGHYTCDKNGNIVCREGWSDPSTKCRLGMHPQISRVGCYNDFGYIAERRLFTTFVNYRFLIDWSHMNDSLKIITELCSSFAKIIGFQYFGIEFWGECWTGSTLDINYDRDGESSDCWPGQAANLGPMLVGKNSTIMVYKWDKLKK